MKTITLPYFPGGLIVSIICFFSVILCADLRAQPAPRFDVKFDDETPGAEPSTGKALSGTVNSKINRVVRRGAEANALVRSELIDSSTGRKLADGKVLALNDWGEDSDVNLCLDFPAEEQPKSGRLIIAWDMLIVKAKTPSNLFLHFCSDHGMLGSMMIGLQTGQMTVIAQSDSSAEVGTKNLSSKLPIGHPIHIELTLDLDEGFCSTVLNDLEVGAAPIRKGTLTGLAFATTKSGVAEVGLDNIHCGPADARAVEKP